MRVKEITFAEETQQAIKKGVDAVYNVAAAAYGAKGGNVLLERQYGDPTLSRDGVTNVREVFLPDRVANMAARVVVQASQKNNETVGDGTTAAVILTKHLYDRARMLVGSGSYDRMTVSHMLEATIAPIHERLEQMTRKVTDEELTHVATISAGDPALGRLIADSISAVGLDGGVVVERHAGLGVYNDLQDGFYLSKGFINAWLTNNRTQLRSEHSDVNILITEKRLSGLHEMASILDQCLNTGIKRLVIVGEVADQALDVLLANHVQGKVDVTAVDPPAVAGNRSFLLEDLAIVTGGRVFTDGMSVDDFDTTMLGRAERVLVTEFNTSIVGGAGAAEDVEKRIADLKGELKGANHPQTVQAIQDRLSKLTGKICLLRVGGATPADADYMKLRVDDAVSAVRAAMKSGVLPGGGVALIRCREAAGVFAAALSEPCKLLFSNAGANAELHLAMVEAAGEWVGYDLNRLEPGTKPQDMMKLGVIDPLDVIKEVVVNAATTAARLITTSAAIVHADDPDTAPTH